MKLRRLELTGFRGAFRTLTQKFSDNNYFVYAENGRGKSTIADAIEFLINGDLERFIARVARLSQRSMSMPTRQSSSAS